MTEDLPESTENLEKLEKVLNLWKTKKFVSKFKAKKKTSLDDTVMFLGRKISKKLVVPNSLEDITITSQRLCEGYIEARLARSGIKEFDFSHDEDSEREEYCNVLQNMGLILEMKYPKLYSKMSVHLKLSYDSEVVVWDSFNKFATNLFSEGITWAKVIAFYAFTGGLALDCISHGKNALPGRIVYWFGVFMMKKISGWIQEQGGWNAIVDHFNTNPLNYDMDNDDDMDDDNDEIYDFKTRLKKLVRKNNQKISVVIFSIIGFILSYLIILYY